MTTNRGQIVVAGAGYAGLHVALRLANKRRDDAAPVSWTWLVLALGSTPNDFAIPGLAQRALSLYSAADAEKVWTATTEALKAAAAIADPQQQRRQATVVVGGGGATGVELAGELAEMLPGVASGSELAGRPLEAFTFHDKGFVVSVGTRRGVADVAGITTGGRLAHVLKDSIEWEYRESVKHLRGWDPIGG